MLKSKRLGRTKILLVDAVGCCGCCIVCFEVSAANMDRGSSVERCGIMLFIICERCEGGGMAVVAVTYVAGFRRCCSRCAHSRFLSLSISLSLSLSPPLSLSGWKLIYAASSTIGSDCGQMPHMAPAVQQKPDPLPPHTAGDSPHHPTPPPQRCHQPRPPRHRQSPPPLTQHGCERASDLGAQRYVWESAGRSP